MKPKLKNIPNAASVGLTEAENAVYRIVRERQRRNRTTTSGDVAVAWDGKNRQYVWRKLEALIEKGLIERYSGRYYRTV